MVENIFTDTGCAGGVEVNRGNNRAVVRNEEVAVYRHKYPD